MYNLERGSCPVAEAGTTAFYQCDVCCCCCCCVRISCWWGSGDAEAARQQKGMSQRISGRSTASPGLSCLDSAASLMLP